MFTVLTTNRIWKARLVNIGSLNFGDVTGGGVSGPILRSVGIKRDLRFLKAETYSNYWFLTIRGYLGKRGDSYDRFLIRMREMYESISIVMQILSNIFQNKVLFKDQISHFGTTFSRNNKYNSMEDLIKHFKEFSEGRRLGRGLTYRAVEAPKGEFGVWLVSDGTSSPFRCKIRTPAYHHMQIMPRLVQGHLFADLVTVLGSQDIVFGDVDR